MFRASLRKGCHPGKGYGGPEKLVAATAPYQPTYSIDRVETRFVFFQLEELSLKLERRIPPRNGMSLFFSFSALGQSSSYWNLSPYTYPINLSP